jgi:adenylyl-sulfate kinase
MGMTVQTLDGDEVRTWLSPNEGFSREDRERHLRRVAHICELLSKNGVVVLASFVSPYRSSRDYARSIIPAFAETHVKCSLETAVKRDPKGLYKRASSGQMTNMTGLQDVYEEPSSPEIVVDTDKQSLEQSEAVIISRLRELGYI